MSDAPDIFDALATCSIDGCDRGHNARGWCRRHYEAWRRHGDPLGASRTVGDPVGNFWRKVDVGHPLGCWVWTAAVGSHGYGVFNPEPGTTALAHRHAYTLLVGPIPDGLDLDHLCRNRVCVNPDHVEPVTRRENVQRGTAGHRMARMNREGWAA